MNAGKGNAASAMPRRMRAIEISPIARAVCIALAASAIALAGSGAAFAGTCTAPDASNTVHCNGDFADTITYDTNDLTLVVGDDVPTSVIPPLGHDGIVVTATGALAITTDAYIFIDDGVALSAIGRTVDVTNTGSIDTAGFQPAGVIVRGTDSASFTNTGSISARSYFGMVGVDVSSNGDIQVRNAAGADVYAVGGRYYDATAISGHTTQGDVVIENAGVIRARLGGYYGGTASGIVATSDAGNVTVTNVGSIGVEDRTSGQKATGIAGLAQAGVASIENAGSISAYSDLSRAFGIVAQAREVVVDNSGSIEATTAGGYTSIGILALATDDATVTNSGQIRADGIGIYSYSADGEAGVDNSGGLTVFSGFNGPADGIFASGIGVDVASSGAIDVTGDAWAAGVEAQGTDDLTGVTNGGAIVATASDSGYGWGLYVTGGDGGIDIGTTGTSDIAVVGGSAIGISARDSGAVGIAIGNAGGISASGAMFANGISATSDGDGSAVAVDNSGDISVDGGQYVAGIQLVITGAGAHGSIDNAGNVSVDTTGEHPAFGLVVSSTGNADIDNSGSVLVNDGSFSRGAFAFSSAGDASVANAGDIDVTGAALAEDGDAYGILSTSQNGMARASNDGSIAANGGFAAGINVDGAAGSMVDNRGIIATQGTFAHGILAGSSEGDTTVDNSGSISVIGEYAFGVLAISGQRNVSVSNRAEGAVDVVASGDVVGLLGIANAGDVTIDNAGDVTATGTGTGTGTYGVGGAIGIHGSAVAGMVAILNAGDIAAQSLYGPVDGIVAAGDRVAIDNTGNIEARGRDPAAPAIGIRAQGGTATTIANSGSIDVVVEGDGTPIGISAQSPGDILIGNSGTITASGTSSAVAIDLRSATTGTLRNSGTLRARGNGEVSIAVSGGDGIEDITNTGAIHGALVTAGGADRLRNDGGFWDATDRLTNFGAGDDAIDNAAGGSIRLADATIRLGSGNNTFDNLGTIEILGNSLIDMGSGPGAQAGGASAARSGQMPASVPSLNTQPLANNGVIDFQDGVADDMLTILGDLGGNGALNLDLDLVSPTGSSDRLYVDGSVVGGASQRVNVTLPAGTPISQILSATSVGFAQVSGDSSADSFVPGVVTGYSPNDFLTFGLSITSQLDPTNASNDLFSVQIGAGGPNDAGVLAASISPGAQSLMATQIGTWRQRMGVVPGNDDAALGAFVRVFHENGEIDPSHRAINFGQDGNFDFDQTNSGTEVGLNFEAGGGINLGVTLAKAEGRQRLIDPGMGADKIQADTVGLYGTWVSPGGFYVDASYRAMHFDARLQSAAELRKTTGRAGAINLEAGYAWTLSNGLNIEPQFQYTWTTVDGVFVQGDEAYFRSDDGDWQRGRLGVAAWMPFESGSGITWTPYGAVSAVRMADGGSGYAINDDFSGSTTTKGTSALVELGTGMRVNGFSATAGANWSDGGALTSVFGGQVVLRYDW